MIEASYTSSRHVRCLQDVLGCFSGLLLSAPRKKLVRPMEVDRYCQRGNEFEPDIIGRVSIHYTNRDFDSRKVLHFDTITEANLDRPFLTAILELLLI